MSQTITVPKPENRLDQTDADFRPLFINWADSSDNYTKHDLFDDFELRQYSVLFWDPLQFAYDHKLRTPDREISTTQYVSYSQSKLVTYFSKTKSVSARLKKYLSGGGVLVIRSNIPRSFIKMMSSSQASNTDYTKAITPVFSWLESLIGKYSMQYFTTKTLNFVAAEDPLQDQFGNSPITCMQSLISIGTGRIEVVAGTGKMSNLAAISKITFGEQPGQIYFVPKFNVQAEVTDLVEAFKKIVNGKQSHTSRPKWLSSFDEILQDNCPHTPHREKLRLEIDALKKQSKVLEPKQKLFATLTDLLYTNGPELHAAVMLAMRIIGFDTGQKPVLHSDSTFKLMLENHDYSRAIVRIASTVEGPISGAEVIALQEKIETTEGRSKPKGILVGNAARDLHPDRRTEWFDEQCITEVRRLDICLITSFDLFYATCLVARRQESEVIDILKSALIKDILNCDKKFAIDRRRYGV